MKYSSRIFYAASLILIATGLLALSLGGFLDSLQDFALRPISAVQSWTSLRFASIRDLTTSPRDIASLRSRNAELEAETARLKEQVVSLQEQLAETKILAVLVNYARNQPENRYMAADVIGSDTSPFLRSIWIGRGSDDGLAHGMPVVTENGLVGRIVEVRATMSRIELIIDPEMAVNVRLQNCRAEGILSAQIDGEIWVDLIPQDKEITPGELVLTSGMGGNYPTDIPIGKVINIRKRDYEIFQQAVIEPFVDFNKLEIVLVITNFRPLPETVGSP